MLAFGQKKIERFDENNSFKVITPEKVLNSIQDLNSRFLNDIKDLCTDKAYEKSHSVIYAYNDEKKNSILGHLPKIPKISHGISFYFASIIQDNDNDKIRFYL